MEENSSWQIVKVPQFVHKHNAATPAVELYWDSPMEIIYTLSRVTNQDLDCAILAEDLMCPFDKHKIGKHEIIHCKRVKDLSSGYSMIP